MVAGLDVMAFALWARLSGVVPRIGIASGRCFAGNAALLGCSDLIIATPEASIGMGGPAMIEGGGLGVVDADEVGPFDVQATQRRDRYRRRPMRPTPSVSPGRRSRSSRDLVATFDAPDQRALRDVVPENRRRAYDVHRAIEIIADSGSTLELRPRFGRGMVTVLARIDGHPGRDRRQQSDAPRRRDHQRLRRQGGALSAAVRGVPAPGALPLRYAGHHGRAGRGEDGARAPREPPVSRGRGADGALHDRGAAQGIWARRAGDGGWELPCAVDDRCMAHRRVRRHGTGGSCEARLPQGAGGDRRRRCARERVRCHGRGDVRARDRAQHRNVLRGR